MVEFRPAAGEAAVPANFRLEEATFRFQWRELRNGSDYDTWNLRFPSPLVSPDAENNTVHAEYFRPRLEAGRKVPAVVVLHILGADFALSRYMAARLADNGVAALFVKLPYYGERRPPGVRFLSADIERSVSAMRQGVLDVRRALVWLKSRDEVDPERLGVAGISLGGIVSALVASVDPEVDRAALLLAGGGLDQILWEMPEAAKYRERWVASGRDRDDLRRLTEPLDPLTYAAGMRGKRVLMLNGNVDEVIPADAARRLWKAAGRPELQWFDCGHYSAAGYLLPGIRQAVEFLAE